MSSGLDVPLRVGTSTLELYPGFQCFLRLIVSIS